MYKISIINLELDKSFKKITVKKWLKISYRGKLKWNSQSQFNIILIRFIIMNQNNGILGGKKHLTRKIKIRNITYHIQHIHNY